MKMPLQHRMLMLVFFITLSFAAPQVQGVGLAVAKGAGVFQTKSSPVDLHARDEDQGPATAIRKDYRSPGADDNANRPASPGGTNRLHQLASVDPSAVLNAPSLEHPRSQPGRTNIITTATAAICAVMVAAIFIVLLLRRLAAHGHRVRALEQQVNTLSRSDPVTKLLNRATILEETEDHWDRAPMSQTSGIIVLKVQGLKRVNDQFGLRYGDWVLKSLARDLSGYLTVLHPENRTARTGNAEFTCLVRDVEDDDELNCLAVVLQAIVSVPIKTTELYITLTADVGTAHGSDAMEAEHALSCAEQAAGRSDPPLADNVLQFPRVPKQDQAGRARTGQDVTSALLLNEFYPVYQPQIDMRSGEMVGFEALARWQHPDFGMIPPDEFIGVAENSGQISDLGQFMLRTACEDAMALRGNSTVSVNLSALQVFQDDVCEQTRRVLDETGLEPGRLNLEVTETVLIRDKAKVYLTLSGLKKLGVAVSLDDFGTGYSGLSYLSEFEWDELKIDRSFVAKALESERAQQIAETVANLAGNMGARLTVEGIETARQRDLFASLGYEIGQGFFYSRPMVFDHLSASPYVLTSRKAPTSNHH